MSHYGGQAFCCPEVLASAPGMVGIVTDFVTKELEKRTFFLFFKDFFFSTAALLLLLLSKAALLLSLSLSKTVLSSRAAVSPTLPFSFCKIKLR